MTGFLLDTNVLSETRKPKPHGGVIAWLRTLDPAQIFICAFSFGEIQWGIERTRENAPSRATELELWLDAAIKAHRILPMDAACFREWGRIVKGKSDHLRSDALIAAAARVHGLTVATRNVKDFTRFHVPVYNPFDFARE